MDAGNSRATIAWVDSGSSGAVVLKGKFGILRHRPMPIASQILMLCDVGLQPHGRPNTTGDRIRKRPPGGHDDRCSSHFHAKSLAVFGDPDTVIGLVSLAVEMGMNPSLL